MWVGGCCKVKVQQTTALGQSGPLLNIFNKVLLAHNRVHLFICGLLVLSCFIPWMSSCNRLCSFMSDSLQRHGLQPQAPLSMGFSRQEYWSGVPFPFPGDLPDPGIRRTSLESPALADGFFTAAAAWKVRNRLCVVGNTAHPAFHLAVLRKSTLNSHWKD